ncbi:class I SAM-dependent methyltransferase [Gordonia alkanivorans]|uniref:class I SAM-dependent methyltransferase n=1 Tax=Gordonia alkanivorans TaxID=84096 RepID=UPI001F4DCD93|nr:methyltransferase domain-containing protein [Gordonia alkanivorans]
MNTTSGQGLTSVGDPAPDAWDVGDGVIPTPLVRSSLRAGVEAADFWTVMTMLGAPQMRPDADANVVRNLVEHCGGVTGRRVADLGSGCGRYAAEVRRHGATEVVGLETSEILGGLSATVNPAVRVVRTSLSNIGAEGSFDVVIAMSHILFINESRDALRSDLRNIRSAMPDFGVLVVEQFAIEPGVRTWGPVDGISIGEQCGLQSESLMLHEFEVQKDGDPILGERMQSLRLTQDEFEEVARDAGFLVSDYYTEAAADGEISLMWILRAQKGFNYLSDIDAFLESWLAGEHERNGLSRSIVVDSDGRVRPEGTVAWGQGASLSRNHPEFLRCLEPAVSPLVVELVTEWNLVTYSSCEGHRITCEPREDYSECYVGVVAFSDIHEQAVVNLLESACAELIFDTVRPRVRQRPLLGPRSSHAAVDLLITRCSPNVPWVDYQIERDRLIQEIVRYLTRMRLED